MIISNEYGHGHHWLEQGLPLLLVPEIMLRDLSISRTGTYNRSKRCECLA